MNCYFLSYKYDVITYITPLSFETFESGKLDTFYIFGELFVSYDKDDYLEIKKHSVYNLL